MYIHLSSSGSSVKAAVFELGVGGKEGAGGRGVARRDRKI